MRGTGLVLVAACILLAGCHESLGLVGDARTEALLDPAVDPGWDPGYDIAPEPAWDVGVDSEPPPPCPPPNPPPDGPAPYWEIDEMTWPPDTGFTLRCNVVDVWEDDRSFTVNLSCPGPSGELHEHSLTMSAEAPFWLYISPGEEVVLEYMSETPWWINRWFALRYAWGRLIVAGVDADRLMPEGADPDDWFHPLGVEVIERGWCPPETTMCGTIVRRGLEVAWGGITAEFVDRTYGSMGFMESVQVLAGKNHRYTDMDCDDVPDEWVSALFVMVPEG